MNVFIVFSSDYECANIVGIYKTEDLARKGRENYIIEAKADPLDHPEYIRDDFVSLVEWKVIE